MKKLYLIAAKIVCLLIVLLYHSVVHAETGSSIRQWLSESTALIDAESFLGVNGIIAVNQSPGNMNNQANIIMLLPPGFISKEKESEEQKGDENISASNYVESIRSLKQGLIKNYAFSQIKGILAINQITGNATSQITNIRMSLDGSVPQPLSENDLMEIATQNNNKGELFNVTAMDAVESSAFTGLQGLLAVSQSAGDLNQNNNRIGFSVRTINLP